MAGVTRETIVTEELVRITRREVARYVGYSPFAKLYPLLDDANRTYEEETTDKPLVDALMVNADVPRQQIILAYAGE